MLSAEHLIAAAEPEHMTAAPDMRGEIDVPALRAQEVEIAARRFRAGHDHEVGIARDRLARPHHGEIDAGLQLQRIEIVEIGDPRQRETRDLASAGLARIAQSPSASSAGSSRGAREQGSTPKPRHVVRSAMSL